MTRGAYRTWVTWGTKRAYNAYAEVVLTRIPRWILSAAAATLALITATGCEVVPLDPGSPGGTGSSADAVARLDELTVAKAGSMRGYSRQEFPHWRDTGE